MKYNGKYIALCAAFLLAGCASSGKNPQEPARTMEQIPNCCEDFASLTFKELPINFQATLMVDEEDPVFEFESGRSFVEAIALPRSEGTILLQVESDIRRLGLHFKPEAIYPVVQLLDAGFDTVAVLDGLPFEHRRPMFSANRIRFVITLDDQYEDARYALIYTSDDRLKQGLSTIGPSEILNNNDFDTMLYARPARSNLMIQFVPTGRIRLLAYSPVSS